MPLSGLTAMQLLVLQPTPFCNLDCGYCYLPERSNSARMSEATLTAIGARIMASGQFTADTTLVWHAGEPLVLPPDWYRQARATLEAASGRRIGRQSFQTNATLIDDAWIGLLSEPGVRVGVSLDGPAFLHDRHRRTRAGTGTWAATMAGVARLRAAGVPFDIICVVTEASLDHPEALAQALVEAGPGSIGLNLEEVEGVNTASTLIAAAAGDRVRGFIARFVDHLDAVPSPPRLRERAALRDMLGAARRGQSLRNQENAPGAILSVDVRGDISTYSPELMGMRAAAYDDFRFGNVHRIRDYSDIYLNPAFLRCQRDIAAGVARCRKSCGHFALCGGGTPSNKFGETGRLDGTETGFCRLSVKTLLDALVDREIAGAPPARARAGGAHV